MSLTLEQANNQLPQWAKDKNVQIMGNTDAPKETEFFASCYRAGYNYWCGGNGWIRCGNAIAGYGVRADPEQVLQIVCRIGPVGLPL